MRERASWPAAGAAAARKLSGGGSWAAEGTAAATSLTDGGGEASK